MYLVGRDVGEVLVEHREAHRPLPRRVRPSRLRPRTLSTRAEGKRQGRQRLLRRHPLRPVGPHPRSHGRNGLGLRPGSQAGLRASTSSASMKSARWSALLQRRRQLTVSSSVAPTSPPPSYKRRIAGCADKSYRICWCNSSRRLTLPSLRGKGEHATERDVRPNASTAATLSVHALLSGEAASDGLPQARERGIRGEANGASAIGLSAGRSLASPSETVRRIYSRKLVPGR